MAEFPLSRVRRFLEPGPVVLISSACAGERNVMTLGWHVVLAFTPALVGLMISAGNHSFDLIRGSGECVINLPTADMVDLVARIGNMTGAEVDKFAALEIETAPARHVAAPLLPACYAQFECRLFDDRMVDDYNLFVFEIVAAHVRDPDGEPDTLHYTGDGVFHTRGATVDRHGLFTKVS